MDAVNITLIGDQTADRDLPPIYATGDAVWYDGVAEVARRFLARIVARRSHAHRVARLRSGAQTTGGRFGIDGRGYAGASSR